MAARPERSGEQNPAYRPSGLISRYREAAGANCLSLQHPVKPAKDAARAIARRFDDLFRPLGITQGQFSLLMSLNRQAPPNMNEVADVLSMDRTTLTANLKPLERRGLVEIVRDERDRRNRRLQLTASGRNLLKQAVPLWRAAHDELDSILASQDPDALRRDLLALSLTDT